MVFIATFRNTCKKANYTEKLFKIIEENKHNEEI